MWLPTFVRNTTSIFTSIQKVEAVDFSKMLVTIYRTAWRHSLEDINPNFTSMELSDLIIIFVCYSPNYDSTWLEDSQFCCMDHISITACKYSVHSSVENSLPHIITCYLFWRMLPLLT